MKKPISIDKLRAKKLAKDALDAINFISTHGSDSDVDVMSKILLLDIDGMRELGHMISTEQELHNACAVLLAELKKEIQMRNIQ